MLGNLSEPFIWFVWPTGKERVELCSVYGGNFTGCLFLKLTRVEALLCNSGDGVWVSGLTFGLTTWCFNSPEVFLGFHDFSGDLQCKACTSTKLANTSTIRTAC